VIQGNVAIIASKTPSTGLHDLSINLLSDLQEMLSYRSCSMHFEAGPL